MILRQVQCPISPEHLRRIPRLIATREMIDAFDFESVDVSSMFSTTNVQHSIENQNTNSSGNSLTEQTPTNLTTSATNVTEEDVGGVYSLSNCLLDDCSTVLCSSVSSSVTQTVCMNVGSSILSLNNNFHAQDERSSARSSSVHSPLLRVIDRRINQHEQRLSMSSGNAGKAITNSTYCFPNSSDNGAPTDLTHLRSQSSSLYSQNQLYGGANIPKTSTMPNVHYIQTQNTGYARPQLTQFQSMQMPTTPQNHIQSHTVNYGRPQLPEYTNLNGMCDPELPQRMSLNNQASHCNNTVTHTTQNGEQPQSIDGFAQVAFRTNNGHASDQWTQSSHVRIRDAQNNPVASRTNNGHPGDRWTPSSSVQIDNTQSTNSIRNNTYHYVDQSRHQFTGMSQPPIQNLQIYNSEPSSLHNLLRNDTDRPQNTNYSNHNVIDKPMTQSKPTCSLPRTITFNGTGEWKSFYTKFGTFAKANGWSGKQCKDQLCWCLEGRASEYFTQLTERDPHMEFFDLVGKFERRFDIKELPESLMSSFLSSKQRQDENLMEWADRVITLASRAYCELPEEKMYKLAIGRFCQGLLDKEAGQFVANNRPTSMDDAVDRVRSFQHNAQVIFGKRKEIRMIKNASEQDPFRIQAVSKPNTVCSNTKESNDKIESLELNLGKLETKVDKLTACIERLTAMQSHITTRSRSPSPLRRNTCYNCGEEGHFKSACPKNKSSTSKRVSFLADENLHSDVSNNDDESLNGFGSENMA